MEAPDVVASTLSQDLATLVALALIIGTFITWRIHKREERDSRRRMAAVKGAVYLPAFTYRSPLLGPKWIRHAYDTRTDGAALEALGLPILSDGNGLARALTITLGQLTWLTAHESHSHYREFPIAKRGSRERRFISAPRPHLKRAQRWILEHVLQPVAPHPSSTAFSPGNSIMANSSRHTGRELVVRFDLQNFFPTIRARRVRGLFQSFGYSQEMSILLANLTTYELRLPQGAPTSPAIANLVCRRLDARLDGLARRLGAAYTRYADDLNFSGDRDFILSLKRFIPLVRSIVREEGFRVNKAKTRFARKGAQQRVTGLVVNRRVSVPREERRRLRAIVHNLSKGRPATGREATVPDLRAHLHGRIAFLSQTHPDEAARLRTVLNTVPAASSES